MKTETFTGASLAEANQAFALWKVAHPKARIIKQHDPTEMRQPVGRFAFPTPIGKIISVTIAVDYEISN
jgi:hypothetical protein